MWKQAVGYSGLLAAGALAFQWLDHQRMARVHSGEIIKFLIAAAFLTFRIFIGKRAFAGAISNAFDGNPKALASLGISQSELGVLHEVAAGRSNKEIAAQLHVSTR